MANFKFRWYSLIITTVCILIVSLTIQLQKVQAQTGEAVSVSYKAHVQNIGWQDWVSDGQEAGTDGKALGVEALQINLVNAPAGANIKYLAHVQNVGWQNPVSDGQEAGTDGKALSIEALKITLENMPGYSIQYQAHVRNVGWQTWVSDGQQAGTVGKALCVEAIRIRLVKISDNSTMDVQYQGHVGEIGWQSSVTNGQISGTEGLSLGLEALKVNLIDAPVGASIKYVAHVENIGWQIPVSDGQEAGTEGQAFNIEAMKISLENMPGYSVQYQAHVENVGWQAWVSDGQEAGTVGKALRIEAIRIRIVSTTVHPTSVSINKATDDLTVSESDTLVATITPENALNKAVTWSSSKTDVATVDNTGKVTAVSAGLVTITATTVDGNKTANCTVTVGNKKGYVYNPEPETDLKVRSAPNNLNVTNIIGSLYNYDKVEILGTIVDSGIEWDKIKYNNGFAYASSAYVQPYTSPVDPVVTIAKNITKQFEVGTSDQISGNVDGQGLSLGYLQWCIGQGTLQPLLHRMDRQNPDEMKTIFGTNYGDMHNLLLLGLFDKDTDTEADKQLKRAKWTNWTHSINDPTNNIIESWHSQFVSLSKNSDFIKIEAVAEVDLVKRAMLICNKYNLRTVRGFALAFDIATQNGSISSDAATIIDTALEQSPTMTEKSLLAVIANAVANGAGNNAPDVLSRKIAIVNGHGTVHDLMLDLDKNYGLSDIYWR